MTPVPIIITSAPIVRIAVPRDFVCPDGVAEKLQLASAQFALLITEGQVKRESMTPFFRGPSCLRPRRASAVPRPCRNIAPPRPERYHPRRFPTRPRGSEAGSGSSVRGSSKRNRASRNRSFVRTPALAAIKENRIRFFAAAKLIAPLATCRKYRPRYLESSIGRLSGVLSVNC